MNKKLYLIDGHAQIYSAFFAPTGGQFSTPSGEPTNATMIFTSVMLKLLRRQQPDMMAVAMDAPGPTFRHEMFAEYKANRPSMPDELRRQIDRIEEILVAMGIPILRVKGYEADDVIGTVVQQASGRGYETYICSRDKDLEQLLDDSVVMYDPKSDQVMDAAALQKAKGISPGQVVDVLALAGDTSDNIPGVPDVGPKTAAGWINKYGSLDELLAQQDKIGGKRGDNLRNNLEQLELSRRLVTIDREVPIELDWSAMEVRKADVGRLRQIFAELGFRRLEGQIEEVFEGGAPGVAARGGEQQGKSPTGKATDAETTKQRAVKCKYHLVDTAEGFEGFLKKLARQKVFALDTETTSVNPTAAELVGLSFCWDGVDAYYLPIRAPMGQKSLPVKKTLAALARILADRAVKKVGQNIKYDMVVLRRAGAQLGGVGFDTMVASYVLTAGVGRHNLDSMAWEYLGHKTIKLVELIGKGKNQLTFDLVDTGQAADYAAEDAAVTWALYEHLDGRLTVPGLRKLFEEVEMPLVEVLAEMEYQGVALDVPALKRMGVQLGRRLDELVGQIHQQAGCEFNVDSPKQLAEVLFGRLGLTPGKKTKTGASTDQEVLEKLCDEHPVAELMLEYRQLSKLSNTYVEKLPTRINADTGRLHASFNQTVAATGRLSSSDPNLQNIPVRTTLGQEIRRAFVAQAAGDVLLAADYSQIELRMLAHLSGDESLQEAFRSGQDIHRFVAGQVFGVGVDEVTSEQRNKAKAVNFGIIYGQSPYGLSRGIGMPVGQAKEFIDDYFRKYPSIKEYFDRVIEQARVDGYVETILGRQRVIADISSSNANRRKLGERMAVNTIVQGSAADMIKVAMINLHRQITDEKLAMKMILQVHDELVFELPASRADEYSELIRKQMSTAIKLGVPVTVDIGVGKNWLECK